MDVTRVTLLYSNKIKIKIHHYYQKCYNFYTFSQKSKQIISNTLMLKKKK